MKKMTFSINGKKETAWCGVKGISFTNQNNGDSFRYDTNQLIEFAIGWNAYDKTENTINLNLLGSAFGCKGKWSNKTGYGFISARHSKSNIEFMVFEDRNFKY